MRWFLGDGDLLVAGCLGVGHLALTLFRKGNHFANSQFLRLFLYLGFLDLHGFALDGQRIGRLVDYPGDGLGFSRAVSPYISFLQSGGW